MSHLKILGAKRMTSSIFHTEDSQELGATVHNIAIWEPGAQDLCTPVLTTCAFNN
jgi:hypothetical protein